jgi:hypothetical protein
VRAARGAQRPVIKFLAELGEHDIDRLTIAQGSESCIACQLRSSPALTPMSDETLLVRSAGLGCAGYRSRGGLLAATESLFRRDLAGAAQDWRISAITPEPTPGTGTKRHVWTTPSKQGRSGMCATVGCGHVSGLCCAAL